MTSTISVIPKGPAIPSFLGAPDLVPESPSSPLSEDSLSVCSPKFDRHSPPPKFSLLNSATSASTISSVGNLSPIRSHSKASVYSPSSIDSSYNGNLRLFSAVSSIPHESKHTSGEDAHFISTKSIGVADGVGGWAALGVDAGMYSRKLMRRSLDIIEKYREVDPMSTLRKAYLKMGKTVGTTTACILTLNGSIMRCANLGDSGFLLLRYSSSDNSENHSWHVVARSRKQQHSFNCPFQIGTDSTEFPKDAEAYEFKVEQGDVLLAGTDGIFDNLFDFQICDLVSRRFPSEAILRGQHAINGVLDGLATDIANEALRISRDETVETPFSVEANENQFHYQGGKEDDITVVISLVYDQDDFKLPHIDSEQDLNVEEYPISKQKKLNLMAESPTTPDRPNELLRRLERGRSDSW